MFGPDYFRTFYEKRASRVAGPADFTRQARFIAAYLALLELPVVEILDLGAGTGGLLRALRRHYPGAMLRGVDASPYACARFGWERGSVATYRRGRWDLVICHDVLQYLPAGDAERAIANLARRCRGALFFMALTREDWETHCDRDRTDAVAVHLRRAAWYAQRLRPHFSNFGGGLFLRRNARAAHLALQRLD